MIRILLVDDHRLLRQGTRVLLQKDPEVEIVAEAEQGEEALALAQRLRPDVVLLDIRLQGLSGVEVARALRQDLPEVKVIILTAYHYEQYVRALFAIGVDGYLLKDASSEELVAAVQAVQRGEQVLSPRIAGQLAARERHSSTSASDVLSDRELEVLLLVSHGGSNKEIAREIGVTPRTVEAHVSSVLAKLGARSRTEAINFARQRGIIERED